jgi:YfiH family protein
MKTKTSANPDRLNGYVAWNCSSSDINVLFLGRGLRPSRTEAFREVVSDPALSLSWPRQIHSATVLAAEHSGLCGDGDALHTGRTDTVLSVVTADCVPIVIASAEHLATVHAGWRGLVAGIVEATLERLGDGRESMRAWIGPAIGDCCYEVGEDVAEQVVAVSAPEVQTTHNPRPHLDLALAAATQLSRGGVGQIDTVRVCTRCSPQLLWSYRRDGAAAGRNFTFAWRR